MSHQFKPGDLALIVSKNTKETNIGRVVRLIESMGSPKEYEWEGLLYVNTKGCQVWLIEVEGAALQTGCTLQTSNYEYSYDELRTNEPLSETFTSNLLELGIEPVEIKEGQDHGSLDLGNVSRRCPAIHPFVQVIDDTFNLHTPEFRDLAMKERALDGMLRGAKALAATAYDVIADAELLDRIKKAFRPNE